MIEKTYSKYIADHADSVARHALLDLAAPSATAADVVPLVSHKTRGRP
jgi:predicted nicotinamide N-methyase